MGTRLLRIFMSLACMVAVTGASSVPIAHAANAVVISQVYGGGGNTSAPLRNDFIELHNRSGATVSLAGWTVQYASAAGSSWLVTALSGSIPAGGYYLVQEASGGAVGSLLPTPDATGTTNMSATAGKVALVSDATMLTGTCPSGGAIVDKIGYGGTANCFEGSGTAPGGSNTVAVLRGLSGCADTDQNSADFATGAPAPRNAASSALTCTQTLTYTAGANGSISGATPQVVNYGDSGTPVTAVADPGYHFVSWSDGVLTATRTDTNVTADLTVTASFAINTYTLTYTAGANGSISGTTPQVVNHGDSGTPVTAVADPGYHFVSWSDGVLTATRTETNVTADVSVTASFAVTTYTLTYTAGANGSISGSSPQVVASGGSGTPVTAVADPGYHFVSWSDGVLTATRTDTNVTADQSVTASFDPDPPPALLVISQVYGGGGNTGAPYQNDYIEIYNRGSGTVSLTGWALQYASASGSTWQTTPLSGSIPSGGYYLVQEAAGAGEGVALPTPDAVGSIPMNATTAKVALTNSTTPLTGTCPGGGSVMDLVGYGAASCAEGSPTGALNNVNADFRNSGGCSDTDDNLADFTIAAPAPRNSASPLHSCTGVLTVTVDPPGSGTVARAPDMPTYPGGTNVQLTATATLGFHFVNWSGDASGSTNPITIVMNGDKSVVAHFATNGPTPNVVISQVYGGGGNSGASYQNDFVELYNRGNVAANITGWSLQYAASGGLTWFSTNLVGTIPAGGYYLIQEAAGVNPAPALPAADEIGVINLAATTGKVALVNSSALLTGTCPTGSAIVDFVGYGLADCSEGPGPTAAPGNAIAGFRNSDGCDDSNNNLADFSLAAPGPRNSASPLHICTEWLDVDGSVAAFSLGNAVPNPTHRLARIPFALPREAAVRIEVLDLQGRIVATLVNDRLPAGRHEAMWNGAGPGGDARPGLYLIRMRVAGVTLVRRASLTR